MHNGASSLVISTVLRSAGLFDVKSETLLTLWEHAVGRRGRRRGVGGACGVYVELSTMPACIVHSSHELIYH